MTKKILIIGGNGFLGINCAIKLNNLGYKITLLCKKRKKNINLKNFKTFYCNILNFSKLKKILSDDFDFVLNFSGNINHKNKIETKKVHYIGLKNIVKVLKNKKIKLFIQAGSGLEYGNYSSPQKEKKTCKPLSIYGKYKYLSSNYLLKKNVNFKVIILRIYQVYGPHQKFDRLIPYVISNCLKNKSFDCSDGAQFRDFLYIEDFLNLIVKIIKHRKNNSNIFNVGSGKPVRVRDVISKINKIIKKGKPKYGSIKMRPEETHDLYPDIKKISKKFSWKPKFELNLGLKKTINYYKKILKL